MRKLLSLLSVLTISVTIAPITIAASSYQKQEKINSDINYKQTNNLKKIKKRSIDKINKIKTVIKTNGSFLARGIYFNNKLYFGSWDHNVYEYDPQTENQKTVIRTEGKILTSGGCSFK